MINKIKKVKTIGQTIAEILKRPVGPDESITKLQDEVLKKRKEKKNKKEKFLEGGQAKIDADNNGVINEKDFEILRAKKKRFGGMAIKGVKENPPIY